MNDHDGLDPRLQQLYRKLDKVEPDAALDAQILKAARLHSPRPKQWQQPFALAASVVMVGSLVLYWKAEQPVVLERAVTIKESAPVVSVPRPPMSKQTEKAEIARDMPASAKAKQATNNEVADALADLREFEAKASQAPDTGGDLQKNSGEPVGTSRNMVSSRAGASSGDLAYSAPASSGFGGGVSGGKGSKGDFSLGGKGTKDMKGGVIAGGDGAVAGHSTDATTIQKEGSIGKRTTEDIRKIFDQNGGRLNNLYQRALKDDPNMEGTVRLKLSIDSNGKALSCEIVSSDLNNPELEAKIVSVVKSFNFGQAQVEVWHGTYPVNFYPD